MHSDNKFPHNRRKLVSKYEGDFEMKVMSYNIQHGVGLDNQLSLERIATVIKESEAEIIALQEVDRYYGERSNFEDQAQRLGELLHFHYRYGANLQFAPAAGHTEKQEYGTAILSKHPIIEAENSLLTSLGEEQRGVLRAKIDVNGVWLHIFNTHLGLDTSGRIAQVQELIAITSAYQGPKVLVGDFNTNAASEELQLLVNQTDFVDNFQHVDHIPTYIGEEPQERIDYIFTSSDITFCNQQVLDCEGSDHLPIVSDLQVNKF